MVNHPPPFNSRGKAGSRRKAAGRREKRREDKTRNRMVFGITCVLAELRAHYPEHQHKEE